MSARHKLNTILQFGWIEEAGKLGKKLWTPSVGHAALKWGGIGAATGAVTGGISAATSDDPRQSIIGGALSGAATGGQLGLIGGAAHRGYSILSRPASRAAAKSALSATARAEQMAAAVPAKRPAADNLHGTWGGNPAAPNTAVADALAADAAKTARAKGIAEMYGAKPASAAVPSQPKLPEDVNTTPSSAPRFSNAEDAIRHPVNESAWNNLHPDIQRRARGVAGMYNDPGYAGDRNAAGAAYHRMRERHGFNARDQLNSIIHLGADPRPRNTLGQFGGEEPGAPNPHAIGMVYKQPGALRTNLMEGAAGGVGFAGAGAAISGLKGLAQKMRRGAKRMSARDKLDAILHL